MVIIIQMVHEGNNDNNNNNVIIMKPLEEGSYTSCTIEIDTLL